MRNTLDVRGALARQGLSENDRCPGDALLFRYGWARFWNEPTRYNAEPPGIGSRSPAFPVHQEIIMKDGIFNLENLALHELARFKVATGSPGRPIAIR